MISRLGESKINALKWSGEPTVLVWFSPNDLELCAAKNDSLSLVEDATELRKRKIVSSDYDKEVDELDLSEAFDYVFDENNSTGNPHIFYVRDCYGDHKIYFYVDFARDAAFFPRRWPWRYYWQGARIMDVEIPYGTDGSQTEPRSMVFTCQTPAFAVASYRQGGESFSFKNFAAGRYNLMLPRLCDECTKVKVLEPDKEREYSQFSSYPLKAVTFMLGGRRGLMIYGFPMVNFGWNDVEYVYGGDYANIVVTFHLGRADAIRRQFYVRNYDTPRCKLAFYVKTTDRSSIGAGSATYRYDMNGTWSAKKSLSVSRLQGSDYDAILGAGYDIAKAEYAPDYDCKIEITFSYHYSLKVLIPITWRGGWGLADDGATVDKWNSAMMGHWRLEKIQEYSYDPLFYGSTGYKYSRHSDCLMLTSGEQNFCKTYRYTNNVASIPVAPEYDVCLMWIDELGRGMELPCAVKSLAMKRTETDDVAMVKRGVFEVMPRGEGSVTLTLETPQLAWEEQREFATVMGSPAVWLRVRTRNPGNGYGRWLGIWVSADDGRDEITMYNRAEDVVNRCEYKRVKLSTKSMSWQPKGKDCAMTVDVIVDTTTKL